jgi:DNA-binding FadR family transcriptional regulator
MTGNLEGLATKIRPTKLGKWAADHLRKEILEGRLKPGQNLPSEVELMRTFGISRPTLREAIRILESAGLVMVYRGKKGGAQVMLPTKSVTAASAANYLQARGTTLKNLIEGRICLEPTLVLALEGKIKKSDCKELREILEEGKRSDLSPQSFARMTGAYRTKLFSCLGNPVLDLIASLMIHVYEPMLMEVVNLQIRNVPNFSTESIGESYRFLELIEGGDFKGASEANRAYLQKILRMMGKFGYLDMRIDAQSEHQAA